MLDYDQPEDEYDVTPDFEDELDSAAEDTAADEFQTGRLATIAGGHAVHDTFTAFLPPLLPRFQPDLSAARRIWARQLRQRHGRDADQQTA